ncbi:hypothetical protein OSTOST_02851 [Ostertagia ostertagi]
MKLLPLVAVLLVVNFGEGAPDPRCLRTTTLRWKKFAEYIPRHYQLYLEDTLQMRFNVKDLVIGYKVVLDTTRNRRPGYIFACILSYRKDKHQPVYLKFLSSEGTLHLLKIISSTTFMNALYECKVNRKGIL